LSLGYPVICLSVVYGLPCEVRDMSEEMVPQPPELRMSDADRERVAARLRAAFGEGRLSPEEFDERLSGVLAARTFGEVQPLVADLPGAPVSVPAPEDAELRATATKLRRSGPWVVARRLRVNAKAAPVKLDFTDALIAHRVVEIDLNVSFGGTTLVLPRGASVDIENVELIASPARVRGVPIIAGDGRRFVVRGRQLGGRLFVRHRRHFLHWSW
jgi:hypothetical protein